MVKLDNSRMSTYWRSHQQCQQFLESFSISVRAHQTTQAKLALCLLVLEAENGETGQQPIVSMF